MAFEVFDGNRADVTTVEEMVLMMEKKYGVAERVWVMDRGMVSEKNLEFMRTRGARYLVGTPKALLRKFERELLEKNWTSGDLMWRSSFVHRLTVAKRPTYCVVPRDAKTRNKPF